MNTAPRRVILLGATGSIGSSAVEVLRRHRDALQLVALAAHGRAAPLAALAAEFGVRDVALADPAAAQGASFAPGTRLRTGPGAAAQLVREVDADAVLVAIVGTGGLEATLAAAALGRTIALASKEVLVLGGGWVMDAVRRGGAALLPVDSEHNGVFQCLEGRPPESVARILLTASGGAFRDRPVADLERVTIAEALSHPTWSMGPKITVDSATMANKGLELIEARWLFDVAPERLDVVIHPQSLVHALVELVDGSVIAQVSPTSMTFAIQHALLYPERRQPTRPGIDFATAFRLEFRPVEPARYPCLVLARAALERGGAAPAVFNAANEVAVAAFLAGGIGFTRIAGVIEATLARCAAAPAGSLDDVLAADAEARRQAALVLRGTAG
jgi:1-deoxy-D-xylulose-5-phosphate reductoisomerase